MQLLTVGLVLLAHTAPSQPLQDEEGPRHLQVTDLDAVHRILDVDVSDDGTQAVYVVRTVAGDVADHGGDSSYRSHLFWVDLTRSDAAPVALTHGERSAVSPAISPDGTRLAFARLGEGDDEGGGAAQVWVLPLDGPGEARQVTALEDGASNPRWMGDGTRLLVSTSVPLTDVEGTPPWQELRPGRDWEPAPVEDDEADEEPADPDGDLEAVRRWLDAGAAEEDPVAIARLAFQGELGLRGPEVVSRVALVDVDGDADVQVLDTGFHSSAGAVPAPDGTWAVFSDRADPAQHPDESRRAALWRLDLSTAAVTYFSGDERASLFGPRITADGRTIWCTSRSVAEPTLSNTLLRRVDVANPGLVQTQAAGIDAHVRSLTVDGEEAWFAAPVEGHSRIVRSRRDGSNVPRASLPGASLDPPPVTGGEVLAFDVGGGRAVYAVSTAEDPSFLVTRTFDEAPRVLARPNAELLDGLALSRPTMHWIERDGFSVQYWVLPALGLEEGERAPVVLSLHGGPHVMWGAGSHTMWHEWQWMAARGYTVVFANPRGSDGYGAAHRAGNYRDWGTGPSGDVLACLDDALVRYAGSVDPERLFVTGGSYAGYLTAWIVGNDQRFRAAVAQRGVYDLVTFFGEGNAWRLVEHSFGGMPWDPEVRGILVRESPFTYVEAMRTPLLILHASRDLRTGVSQSEMLYRALQELDRPVEYVRYPDEGHDLSRTGNPRRRVDRLLRIVEFFERFDVGS